MKCIASFIIVALSVAAAFAKKEVGRYSNGDNYRLYDDNTASLAGTYRDNVKEFVIPAYITDVKGKRYPVTEVEENAFNKRNIQKITIDGNNTGIVIKKNAFYGVVGLKEFNFYSRFVDVEIGGFDNVGSNVLFQGSGLPNAVDKLCEKYLKKWELSVGKNYRYVSDDRKKRDLFHLLKNFKNTFNIYEKMAYQDGAATVAFLGAGSRNGLTRLFRVMAITMGIPSDEILAGCDNIHYCWNYVKCVGWSDQSEAKKWHVLDYDEKIGSNLYYNPHAFQKEYSFVKTLKNFYGKSIQVNPHDFIVHNDRYNYPNESRYNYLNSENFDHYLQRTNGGERTL